MPQDLCHVEDVELLLGNALGTSIDTERLRFFLKGTDRAQGQVEFQSRWFEGQIGRTVDSQSGSVLVGGDGTNILLLPREYTPVISITSISAEATSYDADSWVIEDADAGIVQRSAGVSGAYYDRLALPRWPVGAGNITVVLTYGWATVPADIRGAVARLCAMQVLLWDTDENAQGVTSKRLGDRSVTYATGGRHGIRVSAWIDEVQSTIDNYGSLVEV